MLAATASRVCLPSYVVYKAKRLYDHALENPLTLDLIVQSQAGFRIVIFITGLEQLFYLGR